jgi:hypothetical protein
MRAAWLLTLLLFVDLLSQHVLASPQEKSAKSNSVPWAFQTPVRPSLPVFQHKEWIRNPVDAFVLARLEKEGISPGKGANRSQLIRRLSFDLTGLPPTPEEVDAFVNDPSPAAYERLVERLLASPQYGERWATYWLDLVRYAESDGFRADDVRPNAWRYRDYVIRAFNQDKPYDRFIREQIAGDELYPDDPEALIATGFHSNVPYEFNSRLLELRRQEILNDMTDTTGQVFLGLTVGCARCHDHKFDPISQKDYYRMQAFYAAFWARDDVVAARPEEIARQQEKLAALQVRMAPIQKRTRVLEEPVRRQLVEREKAKFPVPIQEAWDTPLEKRTPLQKQLAELLGKQLQVKRDQMVKAMKPEVHKEWQGLADQLSRIEAQKLPALAITQGVTDIGPEAPPTFVLHRGDWQRKKAQVEPGYLSIIDSKPAMIPSVSSKTTGRRTALANWLTDKRNPLTGRVMVNRLWQHHFGKGIVGTPGDFGAMGEKPSHPELLDWLACEFVENGWSLKVMHRLMVTSAAYRQGTQWRKETAKVDPDNRLLWRMNRRRLEGEALRDAMLAVSGQLNLQAEGPSIYPELPAEVEKPRGGWPVNKDVHQRNRRSAYVFVKRNMRFPFFAILDAPDSNETCSRRHVTTSAPQALMLVNGKFTLDMAKALVERVVGERDVGKKVDRIYRLALGRPPDAVETALALEFLGRGNAVDFCHVVLNLNEFAYVD